MYKYLTAAIIILILSIPAMSLITNHYMTSKGMRGQYTLKYEQIQHRNA